MSITRVSFIDSGKNTAYGNVLGFVSVPFDYPAGAFSNSFFVGQVIKSVEENNRVSGYTERGIIYAIIGCDNGDIIKLPYYKCRYIKQKFYESWIKQQTLLATLCRWTQRKWLALQNA